MNPTLIVHRAGPYMRSWTGVAIKRNGKKSVYWSMERDGLGRSEAIEAICEAIPDPYQWVWVGELMVYRRVPT